MPIKILVKLIATYLFLSSSVAFCVIRVKVRLNYLGSLITATLELPEDFKKIPRNANPGSTQLEPETYLRLVNSVRKKLEQAEFAHIAPKSSEKASEFIAIARDLPPGYRSRMLYDIASVFGNPKEHNVYTPNLSLLPVYLPEIHHTESSISGGSKKPAPPLIKVPARLSGGGAPAKPRRTIASLQELAKIAFGPAYEEYFKNRTLTFYSMGTQSQFFYDSRTQQDFERYKRAFQPSLGLEKFEQKKYDFIHGETVATLARYAEGKEYINHFRVNGPGTNYDFQRYLRYAKHERQYQALEGNAGGWGFYHRVKNLALITRARMGLLKLNKTFLRNEINPLLQVQLVIINELSKSNRDFRIERVNAIGWSRGAAALIVYSNELNRVKPTRGDLGNKVYGEKISPEKLDVNLIAIDPVPGPAIVGASSAVARAAQATTAAAFYDQKVTSLSNLVKNYVGFYSEDFRGFGFDAVVPYHTHQDLTKRIYKFPGGHGTVSGGCNSVSKGLADTVSPGLCLVGQLVRLKSIKFLSDWGSGQLLAKHVYDPILFTEEKQLQLYHEINLFKRRSPEILAKISQTSPTYFTTEGALSRLPNLLRGIQVHKSFGEQGLTRHMITNSSFINHMMGAIPDFFSFRPGVFVNREHEELDFRNKTFTEPKVRVITKKVEWDTSLGTAWEAIKKKLAGQESRIYFVNHTERDLRIFFRDGVKLIKNNSWDVKRRIGPMLFEAYLEDYQVDRSAAAAAAAAADSDDALSGGSVPQEERANLLASLKPSVDFLKAMGKESPQKYRVAFVDKHIKGEKDAYVRIFKNGEQLALEVRGLKNLTAAAKEQLLNIAEKTEREAFANAIKAWDGTGFSQGAIPASCYKEGEIWFKKAAVIGQSKERLICLDLQDKKISWYNIESKSFIGSLDFSKIKKEKITLKKPKSGLIKVDETQVYIPMKVLERGRLNLIIFCKGDCVKKAEIFKNNLLKAIDGK